MQATGYATIEREAVGHDGWSWETAYVLSVPWVAGISSVSGLKLGGLNYTGFLWLAYLAAGILIVTWHRHEMRFPLRYWLPFAVFAAFSIVWGGLRGSWALQLIAQMSAGLVVAMVASVVIRSDEQLVALRRSFSWALAVVAVCFVYFYYGPGAAWQDSEADTGFSVRPAAMTLTIIAALLVTRVDSRPWWTVSMWGVCLLITVLTGSRMATVAMLVAPLANPLWRGFLVRIGLVAAMALLAVALFQTPIFQQRFFGDEEGSLDEVYEGNYSESGRETIWPMLLDEARRNPYLGVGIGSSTTFLVEHGMELHHPHNEYIRIGFELGLVGLALFLGAVGWQAWDAYRCSRSTRGETQRMFASVCMCLCVLVVMSVTDNPLVYNLSFLHPLFVVIGAAYGAMGAKATESNDARIPTA